MPVGAPCTEPPQAGGGIVGRPAELGAAALARLGAADPAAAAAELAALLDGLVFTALVRGQQDTAVLARGCGRRWSRCSER